jgi:hypothetical protein
MNMEFSGFEKPALFEEDEQVEFAPADTRTPAERIAELEQELLFAGREEKIELNNRIAAIRANQN